MKSCLFYLVILLCLCINSNSQDTNYHWAAIPILDANFGSDSIILKNKIQKKVIYTIRDSAGIRMSVDTDYVLYNEKGEVIEKNEIDESTPGNPCIIKYDRTNSNKIIARVLYSKRYQERKLLPWYDRETGYIEKYIVLGDTSNNERFHHYYEVDLFPNGYAKEIRLFDYRQDVYGVVQGGYYLYKDYCDSTFENGKLIEVRCANYLMATEDFSTNDTSNSKGVNYRYIKYDSLKRITSNLVSFKNGWKPRLTLFEYHGNTNKITAEYTIWPDSVIRNIQRFYYDIGGKKIRSTFRKDSKQKFLEREIFYNGKFKREYRRYERQSPYGYEMVMNNRCTDYYNGLKFSSIFCFDKNCHEIFRSEYSYFK